MSVVRHIAVRHYEDDRGTLGVIEPPRDLDFTIRRVFWLTGCEKTRGGKHKNNCRYLMVALRGSFTVLVGKTQTMGPGLSPVADPVELFDPERGILVESGYGIRVMDFSKGALCLVLADGPYDG